MYSPLFLAYCSFFFFFFPRYQPFSLKLLVILSGRLCDWHAFSVNIQWSYFTLILEWWFLCVQGSGLKVLLPSAFIAETLAVCPNVIPWWVICLFFLFWDCPLSRAPCLLSILCSGMKFSCAWFKVHCTCKISGVMYCCFFLIWKTFSHCLNKSCLPCFSAILSFWYSY